MSGERPARLKQIWQAMHHLLFKRSTLTQDFPSEKWIAKALFAINAKVFPCGL
jgi:hypothetical protein